MKRIVLVFCALLVCTVANAQSRGSLENRVSELERVVYDLHLRISQLEGNNTRPLFDRQVTCMVTAGTYNTVHLGKARTRVEAEANAIQACTAATYNASFCKQVKCDDQQDNSRIRGAVCTVTAGTYNTIHKGEGPTLLEAEYNARQACTKATYNGSFCTAQARCEAY